MSATTDIIIRFATITMGSEFFINLDKCFAEHNGEPAENAFFRPLDPAGSREIRWKDIGSIFNQGEIVMIGYLIPPLLYVGVTIVYYNNLCDRISLNAAIKGFKWGYTEEEMDRAFKLEALCLALHNMLKAYDTVATANYREEPWFRFSKEEWKPLGKLPKKEDN